MFFEWKVFGDLGLGCFLEGIGTVVEGTSDVNNKDTVVFFNNNVWTEGKARGLDGAVGGDVTKADGVCDASHDLVVPLTDVHQVRAAVVEDVGKSFGLLTMATGW